MSIPKEPRQIMINLMYLVLTALLALNVSAEILHAFHVVNSGLDISSKALAEKNDQTFKDFDEQMKNDPKRTEKYLNKAKEAKKLSDILYDRIENLKRRIIIQSKGINDKETGKSLDVYSMSVSDLMQKGELENDRDLEATTNIMIVKYAGDTLKDEINKLRADLLGKIENPSVKKQFEAQMPLRAEDPKEKVEGVLKDWKTMNFEMVPTIAALTLLNKYQNDIRNSEALVVDYLYQEIKGNIVVVDQMQAKVIAPTSYVMAGQTYKADIFVAAYSSTVNPKVYVGNLDMGIAKKDPAGNFLELTQNPVSGGGRVIDVSNGMGKYEVPASGEGLQHYSGAVEVQGPDGKPRYYPFEAEYQTAKGAVVISSDNLNIIYAGIPNPFSVSVPGFAADKVNASVSSGSFTKKSAGKYDANMEASMVGKKVSINVSVAMEQGSKQIGTQEFVVKRIPDPVAQINGITEGKMPASTLKVTPGIAAALKDFYFQGVKFEVVGFEVVYIPRRQDAKIEKNNGARWQGKVADIIQGIKPGDQIIFRNIRAKGPDGTTRSLSAIPLEIQ